MSDAAELSAPTVEEEAPQPAAPERPASYYKILQMCNAIDEELIEIDLQEQINLLEDGKAKVDALKHVIDRCEHQAEFYKKRKQEYADKQAALDNNVKRLKKYVTRSMLDNNFTQFTGNEYMVKLQKAAPSLIVNGEPTIDHKIKYDEFVITKYEWDVKALKEALKNGNPSAAEIGRLETTIYPRFYLNKDAV